MKELLAREIELRKAWRQAAAEVHRAAAICLHDSDIVPLDEKRRRAREHSVASTKREAIIKELARLECNKHNTYLETTNLKKWFFAKPLALMTHSRSYCALTERLDHQPDRCALEKGECNSVHVLPLLF